MAHIIDNTKCTNDTEKFFNSNKTFEDAYAYVKDFTMNHTYLRREMAEHINVNLFTYGVNVTLSKMRYYRACGGVVSAALYKKCEKVHLNHTNILYHDGYSSKDYNHASYEFGAAVVCGNFAAIATRSEQGKEW